MRVEICIIQIFFVYCQVKLAGYWSAVISGTRLFFVMVFYLILTWMYTMHSYKSYREFITSTKTEMFNREELKVENMEKEDLRTLKNNPNNNPTVSVCH